MTATIGLGTNFTWDGVPIANITRIGPLGMTMNMVDSTVITPTDNIRTVIAGLISLGEIEIEGYFDPTEVTHASILSNFLARASGACVIIFPAAMGSGKFTFGGYIVSYSAGDATNEGMIPFAITLKLTTKPVFTPG